MQPQLKDLTTPELKAARGDTYQERENAQVMIERANQQIRAINEELMMREKAEAKAEDKAEPKK